MPNTEPALDSQAAAEFVYLQAKRAGNANVFPIGAITKGREGKELAEMGGLVEGGAVAFTDDGSPVVSAEIMRRAMEYCKMFDKAVLSHSEDLDLTRGGVMNEGFESMRLGLRGMPGAAEEVMVYREIALAELTGARVHILHVSTAGSVELIRRGKQRGVRVSGEACPHHFTLTDKCLRTFDSNYKMAPPLRTEADVQAILEGLRDGTLEVIATDHAPHAPEKKMRELDQHQWHHRSGNATAHLHQGAHRDRVADLAAIDREADRASGARSRHRPRHAQTRRDRRRGHSRSYGRMDD